MSQHYQHSLLLMDLGRLIVQSNGSYAYHLYNEQLDVQQLGADDSLTEVFNYTLSDGYTDGAGLLTLTINGTDDRPVVMGAIISSVQEQGVSPGSNLSAPADTAFGQLQDIDLDEGLGVGFTAVSQQPHCRWWVCASSSDQFKR